MNKKNLVIIAVALTCAVAGAAVGMKNAPAPAPAAAGAVSALFAQSMNDSAGKAQALSMYKGKALIVNFWAPWCAPCVKEMPELAELASEIAPKNIGVIGIGIDTPTNIAQFAAKVKVTYPLYVAGMTGTDLAREFGNKAGGLPYTVLIGADGKVKKTYLGQIKFKELKADLAKL
ncbi:TlpA disulfide reductase family protein [Massilia sp. R2A-15]|uniref:TlpA family protein disulfide reductase n=1 Tax=Massilia sp. R2A-15 TaxID=3064278 RepID=UPI002732D7DE|nr:TlpA disulfide reductase family protein [Massilia sp. R2A-15]WLI88414.1 TlpA disulfide reductase family protein [Massilia sp. R2A-15]